MDIETGDRIVAKRPDGDVEAWKVIAFDEDIVELEHTDKTDQKDTDEGFKEFPVSRTINRSKLEDLIEKPSVSHLKDPLEELYFYSGDQ